MVSAALLLALALTPTAVCETPSRRCPIVERLHAAQAAQLSQSLTFPALNSTFSSFAIRYSPLAISSPSSRPATLRDDPRAKRWRDTLFWSLILFLILIVASVAIIRFSRRYLTYLRGQKPDAPTASQDVWSMHKLPANALDPPSDPSAGPDSPTDPDSNDSDDDAPPPSPKSDPPAQP